jgi:hypothetical protein
VFNKFSSVDRNGDFTTPRREFIHDFGPLVQAILDAEHGEGHQQFARTLVRASPHSQTL